MTAPQRPDPERVRRLAALSSWHQQWALARVDRGSFHPGGRKLGSDYSQHHVDVDDDDDAFHVRAREILGLSADTS